LSLFLFVLYKTFTLLVSNGAAGLASGLAGSLAFAAACIEGLLSVGGLVESFYVFHFYIPF